MEYSACQRVDLLALSVGVALSAFYSVIALYRGVFLLKYVVQTRVFVWEVLTELRYGVFIHIAILSNGLLVVKGYSPKLST